MSLRHPIAALLGVAGLVAGAVAAFGPSASAADDSLTGTTNFTCTVTPEGQASYPSYAYPGQITLTAGRPEGSSTVTIVAHMSDMSGVAPVPMTNQPFSNKLVLDVAGTAVTLNGSGTVNAAASQSFAMPDLQGTFTSSAATVAVTVTSFTFRLPFTGFAFDGACTPTSGAALGTLTLSTGTVPTLTPTPTPTTTTSATATPSASTSASATPTSGTGKGKPAKGSVTFSCVLNPLNSDFDYPATITVSGYREKAADDISLSAKMSDLPGISPVPIDGQMDVTLDLVVGKAKTTLKGSTHAVAGPKEKVPVPTLSGSVAGDDEADVAVTGFTFDFAAMSINAVCETSSTSIGTMKVGTEPIDDDGSTGGSTTAAGGSTTGGSSLPKTGGGDALPVVGLWAVALVLLGAAGLLCVPSMGAVARRKH